MRCRQRGWCARASEHRRARQTPQPQARGVLHSAQHFKADVLSVMLPEFTAQLRRLALRGNRRRTRALPGAARPAARSRGRSPCGPLSVSRSHSLCELTYRVSFADLWPPAERARVAQAEGSSCRPPAASRCYCGIDHLRAGNQEPEPPASDSQRQTAAAAAHRRVPPPDLPCSDTGRSPRALCTTPSWSQRPAASRRWLPPSASRWRSYARPRCCV